MIYSIFKQKGTASKNKYVVGCGIPVSIGMGPSKSLAKIANKIAKKYDSKTGGIYCINNEDKRVKALNGLLLVMNGAGR